MNHDQTCGSLALKDEGKTNSEEKSPTSHIHQKEEELSSQLRSLNQKLSKLKSMIDQIPATLTIGKWENSPESDTDELPNTICSKPKEGKSVLNYRLCSLLDFLQQLYGFDGAGVFLCTGEGRGIKSLALSSQSDENEKPQKLETQVETLWKTGEIKAVIRGKKRQTLTAPRGGDLLIVPFRLMDKKDGFCGLYFEREVLSEKKVGSDMILWTEVISSCIENSYLRESAVCSEKSRSDLFERERIQTMTRLGRALTHEINNPLQVIVGRTQLLKMNERKSTDNSRTSNILDIIESNAEKICFLVKDFSDYLHRQSDQIIDRGEVNILHILNGNLPLIKYLLNSHKIHLETDLGEDIPSVMGDPGDLETAVLSLIWELESRLSGGGNIAIRIRSEKDFVCLDVQGTVKDTSASSVDVASTFEGNRIEMASEILEKYGGSLESGDNKGDEMKFCLRLASVLSDRKNVESHREART